MKTILRLLVVLGILTTLSMALGNSGQLAVTKPFQPPLFDDSEEMTCVNLLPRLNAQLSYRKSIYQRLSEYTANMSINLESWYSQLKSLEGQEIKVGEGYFSGIQNTSSNGEISLEQWEEKTETVRNDFFYALEVLPECLPETSGDVDSFLLEMEVVADMMYELDSTVSSFVGQMNQLIVQKYESYLPLEKRKFFVKKSTFGPLKNMSSDYFEAGTLMRENESYLNDSFNEVLKKVQLRVNSGEQPLANRKR